MIVTTTLLQTSCVEYAFLSLQCGKSFKKRYTFKMHLLTHIQSLGDSKSVLKTFIQPLFILSVSKTWM